MNKAAKVLMNKYFEENSLVKANIESFNQFINEELDKIIEENREIEPTIIPTNVDEFKIRFDRIWVEKPEITEADGSKRDIYPFEARLRKLTYSAPVFMEVSAHINGIQRESFKTQIGNIPVMLKSDFCHLNGLNHDELVKFNEDPTDRGGYFIINGTEKAVITIEDLASNKLMVEKASLGTSDYVGRIFSERGSYKIPHNFEKLKDGLFYLTFTRVKRIPIVAIIKALGLVKDQEIMKTIGLEDNSNAYINLLEFSDLKNAEDALDYIAKKVGITQSRDIRLERMSEILDKYLLPHIGVTKEDKMNKAKNLCKYLKHFILVSSEEIPTDDKDHYMNKRLRMSGDLLADLFRVNLKVLIGDLLYNFQRIVKRGKFPSIKVIIREKLLTQRIYSSMATGNWVGGRKGVSQRIERLNFLQTESHLQRVISPLSASQENFEARSLHPTHLGRLCPSETPEGTNIGLRKNLALLALVSHKIETDKMYEQLVKMGMEKEGEGAEVYLDNVYVGTVPKGPEFQDQIISSRRMNKLPVGLNIRLDKQRNEIYIETSKGRCIRPLIICKEGKPLLTERHITQLEKGEISWSDLIKQGVIEYLDATEEEDALVAFYPKDLTAEHTHLEVSPIAMVGLVTSLVPFGNYNQGVRLSQGSKNQKQAIGFYAANFYTRMDMDVNLLHYPQYPIVSSIMHEINNFNKHPSGQNITLAIMSYAGYNMEDAIVLNKGSVDRGLGRSTYYRPLSNEELRYSGGLIDEICIPDKDVKGYRSEVDYKYLEDDGIIFPEAKVQEGDVIIGKTSPPRFLSSLDEYNLTTSSRRESSISLKHGEKGIVDFVMLTENEEGNKLVQVRLRDTRIPEIGDKFTSRHGQKGVVSLIVPECDVPFSVSGVRPDIIFSPHGVPSRMTVSHLIELLSGKVGSLSGRRIDGTIFDGELEVDIRKELLDMGFKQNGSETMYNGMTGEMLEAKIFLGNMYYLKLKHMVANKIHSRARGPIQLLTRQPTEGRAKEGGLRLGEMEKDTFVAH
ncbi:DNA-directed RNA polymerase subunit B'', partial [Candidatus Woesearchaeota archaeon]|nr:DNA-directed RNA polymerase subunit B'' [Candidatus Woesearchaeota archaeon]